MNSPSTEVGPGFLAFFTFFFLALALWLLMRNMFARMRRMNIAKRSEEQRVARAEQPDADGPSAGDGPVERGRPDGGGDSAVGDGPEEGERRGDEV